MNRFSITGRRMVYIGSIWVAVALSVYGFVRPEPVETELTGSFISTENETILFSFGLVADVQYCECEPRYNRHFRKSTGKFREMVGHMNEIQPDFVVSLGDFIDRYEVSFDSVNGIAGNLEMPLYHVLGNHDFPFGKNHYEQVLEILGLESNYYNFRYGKIRFIVLDGNDISLHSHPANSKAYQKAEQKLNELEESGKVHARGWNGMIGQKQLSWLENVLETSREMEERVIIFSHFPVYPTGMHNLWNDGKILELIDKYDHVAAHINGHDHAGSYAFRNGTHYLTLKGMVETPDSTAYALIQVYSDRLELTGFGREINRVLYFNEQSW